MADQVQDTSSTSEVDGLRHVGWVHPYDVKKSWHNKMRVYATENVANRYNHMKDSIPIYVKESDL